MPYQLKKLLPRHYRILELCLDGKNYKDIAKEIGLTQRAISNITNSPIFQNELARRRKERDIKLDKDYISEINLLKKEIRTSCLTGSKKHVELLRAFRLH